jgi:hypothetical protein
MSSSYSLEDHKRAQRTFSKSFSQQDQVRARDVLRQKAELYPLRVLGAYLNNPFFRLTDDELDALGQMGLPPGMFHMIAARDVASRSKAPKYVVFCMPKSGSSFVQSALRHALELPFVSLTSFSSPGGSSDFGMNSREQELDELATIKAIVGARNGFVAQHHTRYSPYLGLQADLFGITPIVTVRNILDCIVSFDDMLRDWRRAAGEDRWIYDAQFALPLDYEQLDDAARYRILTHSFGTWLINFHLSWVRGARQGLIKPILIRYEDHVLDAASLVELLSGRLAMTEEQTLRLNEFVRAPDPATSRFNVGRRGRGQERIPEELQIFLSEYAGMFRSELSEDDIQYLVR